MNIKYLSKSIAIVFAVVTIFFTVYEAKSQAAKPVLVALNKADATMAIVDPVSMKLIAKVPTGDGPHEVVMSVDGKTAFVSNYGAQTPGSSISVIDIPSAKELRRVDLSPFLRPHGLQLVGERLYFTAGPNRTVARYDPATNKVDWIMGTGQNSTHMVAVSADQKRIFTTNIGSDTITAFSFQDPPPAGSTVVQIPVGKQPEAVDLSPDGLELWVGLNQEGAIDIVDTVANKSKEKVNLGGRPYRVKFIADGKLVVCTMLSTKELLVIDKVTRKVVRRMKLDSTPMGIVFSADGKTAFVTVNQPDEVLKIDLVKMEIKSRVDIGKGPDGVAVFGL